MPDRTDVEARVLSAVDEDDAATAVDAPGQEVERTEAWGVVGTAAGTDDDVPALILAGHTDVVPPGDLRQWAGVPTLHYGPGDLRLAHGPQEQLAIADLTTAARAFALLALRSCGVR